MLLQNHFAIERLLERLELARHLLQFGDLGGPVFFEFSGVNCNAIGAECAYESPLKQGLKCLTSSLMALAMVSISPRYWFAKCFICLFFLVSVSSFFSECSSSICVSLNFSLRASSWLK